MRQFTNEPGQRQRTRPPNFGSARSDYGDRAYGGLADYSGEGRGWWDRTTDEVSSWLGDEEAARRREMDERRDKRDDERLHRRSRRYPADAAPMFGTAESRAYPSSDHWEDARARDVMTRDVVRVHPHDTLQYAARMMDGYDCGALPVVDFQNRAIGMITDRDIAIRGVAERVDAGQMTVGDVMSDEIYACHVNDSLKNCMRSMSRHQVRRMPIVNDRNRIAGIVSQADIARHAKGSRSGERRAVADVLCAVSEPEERSR